MPNTLTRAENFDGRILGYTAIGIDATADSVAPGTSFALTDADHKVTFVAVTLNLHLCANAVFGTIDILFAAIM